MPNTQPTGDAQASQGVRRTPPVGKHFLFEEDADIPLKEGDSFPPRKKPQPHGLLGTILVIRRSFPGRCGAAGPAEGVAAYRRRR